VQNILFEEELAGRYGDRSVGGVDQVIDTLAVLRAQHLVCATVDTNGADTLGQSTVRTFTYDCIVHYTSLALTHTHTRTHVQTLYTIVHYTEQTCWFSRTLSAREGCCCCCFV